MSLMGAYDDDEAEEEAAKVQRIFGVNVRIRIFSGLFPAKRIYACMYIYVYDTENEIAMVHRIFGESAQIRMFSGFPAERIYAHTYIRTYTYI